MANISAKEVQALREKTGVGMMKCKEALVACDGDMDKAVDYLREKGLATAVKKASRIAAEGVIAQYNKDGVAVLVEVNAETDFVAKNEKFQDFANTIAALVAEKNPADLDALLALNYPGSEGTVEDMRKEKVFVIGENINIRRFVRMDGNVYTYNHGNGKIGVIAKFEIPADKAAEFAPTAKGVCMQIAALTPNYLAKEDVPADVIEKEKEIMMAQFKNDPKTANKPDAILEKMIVGKIGKFYTENCLLEQPYFIDDSMTVGKFISSSCADAKLVSYVRYEKGEGLQKREDNFAEEVANMAK